MMKRHSMFAVALSAASGLLLGVAVYSMWFYRFRSLALLVFVAFFFMMSGAAFMVLCSRVMARLTGIEARRLEFPEALAVGSLLVIYIRFILSFFTITSYSGKEIPVTLAVFLFINLFIFLIASGRRVLLSVIAGAIIAGLALGGYYLSSERIKTTPLSETKPAAENFLIRVHHGQHVRTGLWLNINQSMDTSISIPGLEGVEKDLCLRFEVGVIHPGRKLSPARLLVMAKDSDGKVHKVYQTLVSRNRTEWTTHETDLTGLAPGDAVLQVQVYSTDESHENLKPLVLSNPSVFSRKSLPEVNVVMLVLDALRSDALGCYGSSETSTPVIDRLAAGGILFENAIAASSWTFPSVASILTSRLPSQHGLFNFMQSRIDHKEVNLPEILSERGIFTKAMIGNLMIFYGMNFDQGFNDFFSEPFSRVYWRNTEHLLNDSSDWIMSRPGSPFFAYIHNMDPHHPYLAPGPDSFGPAPSTLPEKIRGFITLFFQTPYIYSHGLKAIDPLNDSEVEELRMRYLGEVEYVDSQIAVLEKALKESGLWENTLFIITSDHGEEFQEHGTLRHGQDLHSEVIRVPLIFSGGIMEGRASRIETPVSLLDLYPTILELYGIPLPPRISGWSLWPLIEGHGDNDRIIFSELVEPLEQSYIFLSAVDENYHFIKRAPLRENLPVLIRLYRWDRDPEESRDLSEVEPEKAMEMERAVDEFFGNLPDRKRLDITYEEGLEEVRERLRALGYLK